MSAALRSPGAVRIVDERPARAMISALARRRASRCAGELGSATGIGATGFISGAGGSGAGLGAKREAIRIFGSSKGGLAECWETLDDERAAIRRSNRRQLKMRDQPIGEHEMQIEWWIVLATLAGPVVAVQTQKWIERATEHRRRRTWIFHALMANRATRLADDYIRALNLIDLEFLPRRIVGSKDRAVINAWRALFGELTQGIREGETSEPVLAGWHQRVDDRLVDLLSAMSTALGYSFTHEELRRGIYYPRGSVEREQTQLVILNGLRAIIEGRESLSMKITEAPGAPELANLQAKLTEKMVTAYGPDGALKVRILNTEENGSL